LCCGAHAAAARLLIGVDQPQPVELWTWDIAPGDLPRAGAHAEHARAIHVRQGTHLHARPTMPIPARHSVIARMDRRHAAKHARPLRHDRDRSGAVKT
jgi:hypothetical protein